MKDNDKRMKRRTARRDVDTSDPRHAEPTCLFVLVDDHLPDPLPLLQRLDDPGQRDVIMGVHQLTAGEWGNALQQLAQGGGKVWRTTNGTFLTFLSLTNFVDVSVLMLCYPEFTLVFFCIHCGFNVAAF